jgi:hypothetical protein
MYTGPLLGLATRKGAVTLARLITFTRNRRVPPSTNSGLAGPGSTFTRLSALMSTIAKAYLSRISSSFRGRGARVRVGDGGVDGAWSAAGNGWPR